MTVLYVARQNILNDKILSLLSSLFVFIFAVYPHFSRFGCEMTLFLSVCVYWAEDVQDYDEGGWFSEEENSDWITSHDAM